jgi:hypothetical protein
LKPDPAVSRYVDKRFKRLSIHVPSHAVSLERSRAERNPLCSIRSRVDNDLAFAISLRDFADPQYNPKRPCR